MNNHYRWVKYRHNTSASLGTWEWAEFVFPNTCKTNKDHEKYFHDNYVEDIIERERYYHSEHYRGIDFEVINPPKEVVEGKIKRLSDQLVRIKDQIDRLQNSVENFKPRELDNVSKKKCRMWPSCGCLKQFKHKDCREPYNWEKK